VTVTSLGIGLYERLVRNHFLPCRVLNAHKRNLLKRDEQSSRCRSSQVLNSNAL